MNTSFRQRKTRITVYRRGTIWGYIYPGVDAGAAVVIRWDGEREVREGFKSVEAAKDALRAGVEVLV